jgi:hypothetical protein
MECAYYGPSLSGFASSRKPTKMGLARFIDLFNIHHSEFEVLGMTTHLTQTFKNNAKDTPP